MGHTPGPWNADFGETYCIRDSRGGRVAICTNLKGQHGMGGRRDGDEVAANTRLIAAAPELLEALQMVRDYIWAMKGAGHEYQLAIDAAIAKATAKRKYSKAAITKATLPGAQS